MEDKIASIFVTLILAVANTENIKWGHIWSLNFVCVCVCVFSNDLY